MYTSINVSICLCIACVWLVNPLEKSPRDILGIDKAHDLLPYMATFTLNTRILVASMYFAKIKL